ncbi:ABC transporter substrate-binding lipoprotein [Clostridiales bacterium S5-A14a]|nr:ABC transporter substrate-binding lipoprotein [Clostridiales bacterium S5-A14a]
MKKFSKLLTLLMILVMCASCFYGCSSDKKEENSSKKIKVVATIFPVYDFLREIGGDKIDLTMLMTPGAETHSYEPTPKDMKTVSNADFFAYVGGDSDEWVDKILDGNKNDKMKVVTLMDCVKTVDEEHVEGMEEEHDHDHDEDVDGKDDSDKDKDEHDEHDEHDHDHDGDEPEQDEHVWTSPKNAIEIVKKLTSELSKVDPDNANYYKENSKNYIKKLEDLDKKFEDVVKNGKRKEIIFGDRFPFRYFVDRYGLKYYAAFPGCSTDTEASASTVAFLTNKVKEDKIPVIFHIELSNNKIAKSIAEATGAKMLQLNAVHNVTKEDFEKGETYLSLMEKNLKPLEEALN